MPSDFPGAFLGLRNILKKHAAEMVVHADTPTDFTLVTRALGPNKKALWFGAVLLKKSAVTFHLMPLYFNPALQATVPAELLARKQGLTCFNFQRPDTLLFAQLDSLTGRARDSFETHGFLKPGPITPEQFQAAYQAAGGDVRALSRLRRKKAMDAARKRAATIKKKQARAK